MGISRFEGARLQRLRKKFEPDPWSALVVAAPAFMRGKESLQRSGKSPSSIMRFSAGHREVPGLKPILKSTLFAGLKSSSPLLKQGAATKRLHSMAGLTSAITHGDIPQYSCQQGSRQHRGLRLQQMRRIVEGQRADKNGNRETDARQNSDRAQLAPSDAVGHLSQARADRQPGKCDDPQRLSQDKTEQNTPGDPAGQQLVPRGSGKRYSGVGQREQG